MVPYPKWLYHPTKDAVIVPDEAAHKALGAGWVESPADFPSEDADAKGTADVDAGIKEAADTIAAVLTPRQDSPLRDLLNSKPHKRVK